MARMQDRCEETAIILEFASSNEESCEKGTRSMVECSDGGNGRQPKKHHRQGDFFRKLRDLNASRVRPISTILDEREHPIQTSEERLSRWKRHFEMMLNVPSIVAAEVIADMQDLAMTDTTEVNREEVEVVVRKLKNGKNQGSDEIVAELVKNEGQVMVDSLWELLREV